MKHNWTYKKLGELVDVLNGYAFKSSNYVKDGIRVIRIANVQKGKIVDEAPAFYPLSAESELTRYMLHEDDILLSLTGNVGRVGLLPKEMLPAALNQRVACLRIKDDTLMFKFLYQFLNSDYFEQKCIESSRGIAQLNMSTEWLKDYLIPIPSLSEQESIVAELDAINHLIDLQEEQLREYDRLAQSLFYTTFGDPTTNPKGWEVKLIGEIGNVERGAGISKKDFVPDGSPCIHYGQLHTVFGPYTTRHISCIPDDLIAKPRIAHPNDVVMAITSEDVEGSCKSTAWMGDYDIIVGSDAAILHHSQNGVYVSYYTQTMAFYIEKEKYANGFKVTHISAKDIESIPIMCPPLALQQSFAVQIEAIEQQKALVRKSLEETRTLLAARMQYYFE